MLEDPPLLVVKKDWARPSQSELDALRGAQSGHVVDAMDGRGALDCAIKPVDPRRAAFIGAALPVETGPSDNLAIIAAVARAKPGDVVVAACDAFTGTAVIGDIVATLARNAGCAALVIDGMARDLIGLEAAGVPVFCRGITPNSCVKSGPGRVGLPVVAGGVLVEAGDVVVGDRDGVVIVPRARAGEIGRRVAAIRAAEAETIAKVEAGLTTFPFMEELLASPRVRYVD